MRILVLSDSHGGVDAMARCVEMTEPNHILHLGDCWADAQALRRLFPSLPMEQVPGNCDWGNTEPAERLLEYGNRRILMMHGHTRHVKHGTMSAICAAREYGADSLLFGHTHQPLVDFDGSLYVMNPGAVGAYTAPTYGIITLNGPQWDCAVYRL